MPVEEPEVNAPAEEAKETEEIAVLEELPVLTVRDTVIFPGALLPITVGRPSSVALVQSLGREPHPGGGVASSIRAWKPPSRKISTRSAPCA